MALVQCVCVCMVGLGVLVKGGRRASAEVVENMASSIHKCANAHPKLHECMCVCICPAAFMCVYRCVRRCVCVHVCACMCVLAS